MKKFHILNLHSKDIEEFFGFLKLENSQIYFSDKILISKK